MIKIAITKGRIEKQVCKLLAEAGFDMDPIFNKDRELLIETKDGISMIFGKLFEIFRAFLFLPIFARNPQTRKVMIIILPIMFCSPDGA